MKEFHLPRVAYLVLVGTALSNFGNGLVLPLLIIYLHEVLHFSLGQAGLLAAAPGFVSLLVGPVWGGFVDKYQPRIILGLGACVQAVAVILLAFGQSALIIVMALTLLALASAAFYPSQSTLFASLTTGSARSRLFGINFILGNAAVAVGALVSGVVANPAQRLSFTLLYLVDAGTFLALAGVVFALRLKKETQLAKAAVSSGSYREAASYPVFWFIFLLSFILSMIGQSALEYGFTAFAIAVVHAPADVIAHVFVANTVFIILGEAFLLGFITRMSRMLALRGAALLWALALAVLWFAGLMPGGTGATSALLAYGVMIGAGEILLAPLLGPLANDVAPPHLRGRFNVALSSSFGLAYVVTPILSTRLISAGLSWLYFVLLLFGCFLIMLLGPKVLPASQLTTAANDDGGEEIVTVQSE